MKKTQYFLALAAAVLLFPFVATAQINAVTETGDAVLLYKDGTWKYTNRNEVEATPIPTNSKKFVKDAKATFLLKSTKVNIGVWINPKAWSFTKSTSKDEFEFQFQRKGGDLYGMLITEKIEIPIESLKEIALENAREVAPDIEVVKEEYRNVNGLKVLMMQMSGTIRGIRFSYYGYYYSNEKGTIQFLTYTSETLFKENIEELDTFLNGFSELK
jgi:hypothetical protein